jgi:hypothetical protein
VTRTLLLHGLESDWIEEEMADDDDFRQIFGVRIFLRCSTFFMFLICSPFRKDVLDQKIRKALEEVGVKSTIAYKVPKAPAPPPARNLSRWKEGPVHNSVRPVLMEFREAKDRPVASLLSPKVTWLPRTEVYSACREGLKKTGLVVTEDSRQGKLTLQLWQEISGCIRCSLPRSRLGGGCPKEVSSKFNFNSFMDHYQVGAVIKVPLLDLRRSTPRRSNCSIKWFGSFENKVLHEYTYVRI